MPVEFKRDSVILEVHGETREFPNDFVWIFAGGEPPNAFLKKIGVQFGRRDMSSEASSEARNASLAQSLPGAARREAVLQ
jgi:thioredoxin reductase